MNEAARPPAQVTIAQVLLTLAALVGLALWFFFCLFLFVLRCDESCSGNQADNWLYSGQFYLGLLGCGLGVAGLALGFTERKGASKRAMFGAFACFLTWVFVTGSAGL